MSKLSVSKAVVLLTNGADKVMLHIKDCFCPMYPFKDNLVVDFSVAKGFGAQYVEIALGLPKDKIEVINTNNG